MKLSRAEKSWILYDVANSAFILILVTTVMPIFFKDIAAKGMDASISTANWGFANSLASLLLALLAPLLGTLADYQNVKKKLLSVFLALGVAFTLLLTTVNEGDWLSCLAIFIVARLGYSGANLFYDAFLVDVTPKERMDWISSSGYAWGYIGSVIPFLAVIGLIFAASTPGQAGAIPLLPAKLSFVIVAAWWLLFSIPLIKEVHQRHFIAPTDHPFTDSIARLVKTFQEALKYKDAFLFLIAYFFYIDGVDTIIVMATAYGREIGIGISMLMLAILLVQIVAFPFALIYGKLAVRFPGKTMIYAGIAVYVIIVLIGFLLPVLPTQATKVWAFWLLALLIATSQGGIQALSRSFYGKLIPVDRSAEFFGFYNIFGKFATIIGPFLMGAITQVTGHGRYGLLGILLLFLAGGLILRKVKA